MQAVIERLRELRRTGTAKNYSAALHSFSRFRAGADISFDELDTETVENYQTWLQSAGLAANSISFYMRILRAVYNRAVAAGLADEGRRPFRTVFTGIDKTPKRAISLADIRRLRALDLSGQPQLQQARDLFMFMFLCRGMSFIDAAFLRKSDISCGVLTYRRHKTGQLLRVKVISRISEILRRYDDDASPYALPIITRPGSDERRQYETALRRVNKALKDIAAMAGLRVALTTYVSRHAWATIAKSKNVPVSVISDALGHESVATTQIYLALLDSSVIDRANDLVVRDL